MSADPAAVEALAQAWAACVTGGDDPFPTSSERKGAAALLESDWLAARDAAMRAEGAAVALRETAHAWQWSGWTVLTSAMKGRSGPALIIAAAQAATDWLHERADAARDQAKGDA